MTMNGNTSTMRSEGESFDERGRRSDSTWEESGIHEEGEDEEEDEEEVEARRRWSRHYDNGLEETGLASRANKGGKDGGQPS